MKNTLKILYLILFAGFTLLTLFLSSSVIFDWFGIRAKEGNYVLFVVVANFISSWLYVLTIIGVLRHKKQAYLPMVFSFILLIIAQVVLHHHIAQGGLYEQKTVYALYFRMFVTAAFGSVAYILTHSSTKKN